MDASIVVAIITGLCTLIGTTLTVHFGNKKTEKNVNEKTDITLYRISELEKKQDKHNTLIERVYRLEDRQNIVDEKLKAIDKILDKKD